MFTARKHLGIGKGEVKWDIATQPSAPTAAPTIVAENPIDKANRLLKIIKESKFDWKEVEELHELLKSEKAKDNSEKDGLYSLLNDALKEESGYSYHDRLDLEKIKNAWDKDFKDAEALIKAEVKNKKIQANTDIKGLGTNIKEGTSEQSEKADSQKKKPFFEYAKFAGQREQAQALGSILKLDPNLPIIADLKDVNIPSLLSLVKLDKNKIEDYLRKYNGSGRPDGWSPYDALRDLGYSSNGSFGSSELGAVKNFLDYYIKLGDPLKADIAKVAEFTRSGLATTDAKKSITESQYLSDRSRSSAVIEYLSTLPDARFRSTDVKKVLSTLPEDPKTISRLATLCGISGNITSYQDLASKLKTDPALKARFYENINTAGASNTTSLRDFLLGNSVAKVTEKYKKIQDIFGDIANKTLDDFRIKIQSESVPARKTQMQQMLAEYEKKGSEWLTGEIKKVAEGAFINIGNNANAIGGSVSFETFVRGLTVSLGASLAEGKLNPAAVVHYDIAHAKITETEKKIIEAGIGVGTSVFPAVIPFVDGSLKATDKLQVYGKGVGSVDSTGINIMGTNGGGIISLSFMNERKSEIEQGLAKLNSVAADFASLKAGEITEKKITEIIGAKKDMTITPEQAKYWSDRMTELYKINGVQDTTLTGVKQILIKGLIESEAEKKYVQEAMNDTDSRSYKGFSIGVGHLFGITFPLVGVYFKEGKVAYKYPELQEIKPEPITQVIPATDSREENRTESQNSVSAQNAVESRGEVISTGKQLAASIYKMSRQGKGTPFDNALVDISNGDYTAALKKLQGMKNSQVAKKIVAYVGDNPEKLAIINTFTYGGSGNMTKESISKKEYNTERNPAVIKAENKIGGTPNPEAEKFFNSIDKHTPTHISDLFKGQLINSSVFATPDKGTHRIDKYPGSVLISNAIFELVTDKQKDRLIKEHKKNYEKIVDAINTQFTGLDPKMTVENYVSILKTGTIPQALSEKGLIFQEGKEPKFIEGRAMVPGNICANRTEAIIHPLFVGPKKINIPGKPEETITTNQTANSSPQYDVTGASMMATDKVSSLMTSAVSEQKDPDTVKKGFETKIETKNVQVGPNDIKIVNGTRTIVVVSGGTQTNVALSTLTRDQAIALTSGRSISLSISTSTQVPVLTTVTGATHAIPNTNPYLGNNLVSEMNGALDNFNYNQNEHGDVKGFIQYLLNNNFPFSEKK